MVTDTWAMVPLRWQEVIGHILPGIICWELFVIYLDFEDTQLQKKLNLANI